MAGPPKAPEPPASGAGAASADDKFAWRQVYHKPDIAGMSALSRREEEALVKDAKANARHVCRDFVAGAFYVGLAQIRRSVALREGELDPAAARRLSHTSI